ncbi:hypothetical protein HON22_01865 [Candidatus Peregrinibacteria bacterium]|nr:hypothetical protein [Candidatus Peregrinibacteria bacterium]
MSDPLVLYPEFSGITEVVEEKDQMVLVLSESFSYIPLLHLAKEKKYTFKLQCKKNTKNIVFLNSPVSLVQSIHVHIVLEEKSEIFFIQQYDIGKAANLDIRVSIDACESSIYKDFSLLRNEGRVSFDLKNNLLQKNSQSEIHNIYMGKMILRAISFFQMIQKHLKVRALYVYETFYLIMLNVFLRGFLVFQR